MPSQPTPVPLSHRCRRGLAVVAATRGRSGCSEYSLPGGYSGATATDLLGAGLIRRHRTDRGNTFLLTPEGLRAAEYHCFEVTAHARAAAVPGSPPAPLNGFQRWAMSIMASEGLFDYPNLATGPGERQDADLSDLMDAGLVDCGPEGYYLTPAGKTAALAAEVA